MSGFNHLPHAVSNLAQDRLGQIARQAGKADNEVKGKLIENLGGPLVKDAALGLVGKATSEGCRAVIGLYRFGGAGKPGMGVLFVETHLPLVFAVEGVGVEAALNEGIAGVLVEGEAFEEAGAFESADTVVKSLDDGFFAREVVVDYACAGAGALCDKRHGRIMETSLDHDIEHGVEDCVALRRLVFDCHVLIVPRPGPETQPWGNPYLEGPGRRYFLALFCLGEGSGVAVSRRVRSTSFESEGLTLATARATAIAPICAVKAETARC